MLTVTPFALLVEGMAVALGRPSDRERPTVRRTEKPADPARSRQAAARTGRA